MITIRTGQLFIIMVLITHVTAIVSGAYEVVEWLDVPMHFSGGMAIAVLALGIWEATIQKITFQKSLKAFWQMVVYATGILGLVALVGIAWEWYEFIFDSIMIKYSYDFRPAQMGLGDTMADLFLDLLGGLLAFILFRERHQK